MTLTINRHLFVNTQSSTSKVRSKKIVKFTRNLLAAVTIIGASYVGVHYSLQYVQDEWNQFLEKNWSGRAASKINVADPVFVKSVVEWAKQNGGKVVPEQTLKRYVAIAFAESTNKNVDPLLTMAIMSVESGFNFMATSHAGAKGLMQVIPYWHKEKISVAEVYDPIANIKAGTSIIREYLDNNNGNVNRALLNYNGSLGVPGANYDKKVLAARSSLERFIEQKFVENFNKQYDNKP